MSLAAMQPLVDTFPYYGGKMRHLDLILQAMPVPGDDARCFYDVFGGSGVVVLNVNYERRTYNDVNPRLSNFFRVLRDRPAELLRLISLTPFSRLDYIESFVPVDDSYNGDSDLEDARRFIVSIQQGFNKAPKKTPSWSVTRANRGYHAHTWSSLCLRRLAELPDRLLNVCIECRDAFGFLGDLDCAGNVLYLDPPYPPHTRKSVSDYGPNEMSEADHDRLVGILGRIRRARVLLSSYRNAKYDSLGWRTVEKPTFQQSTKEERTEILYMNYDPPSSELFLR